MTTSELPMEKVCFICGNTEEWHKMNHPLHPFTVEGGSAVLNAPKKALVGTVIPSDVPLRIALINAGVISYQQLMMIEEELREAAKTGRAIFVKHPADPSDGPGLAIDPGRISPDPRLRDRGSSG